MPGQHLAEVHVSLRCVVHASSHDCVWSWQVHDTSRVLWQVHDTFVHAHDTFRCHRISLQYVHNIIVYVMAGDDTARQIHIPFVLAHGESAMQSRLFTMRSQPVLTCSRYVYGTIVHARNNFTAQSCMLWQVCSSIMYARNNSIAQSCMLWQAHDTIVYDMGRSRHVRLCFLYVHGSIVHAHNTLTNVHI